jgi:hypothetical protein
VKEFWTMMRTARWLILALALVPLAAGSARADDLPNADQTGSVTVVDPNFGAFTAVKHVAVWSPTNTSNPCPDTTKYCYVYTITNDPGSSIDLIGFQVVVASGSVSAAGSLGPPGVAPTTTDTSNATEVRWTFTSPTIAAGASSEHLFISSAFAPSTQPATVNGDFALDAPTTCLGPATMTGEAMPCTIGWWKNRAEGKKGTLQHFPDPEFANLVTAAVALSGGIFTSSADLLAALTSKGPRSILERGRQQLAATLLNLAAGDAFPDNQKCKLFESNVIGTNACGTNVSVGSAVASIITGLQGDNDAQHSAHECSDDINNGIGLGN